MPGWDFRLRPRDLGTLRCGASPLSQHLSHDALLEEGGGYLPRGSFSVFTEERAAQPQRRCSKLRSFPLVLPVCLASGGMDGRTDDSWPARCPPPCTLVPGEVRRPEAGQVWLAVASLPHPHGPQASVWGQLGCLPALRQQLSVPRPGTWSPGGPLALTSGSAFVGSSYVDFWP